MRVLVDVQHPAHVHFFKNIIRGLESMGCDVKITAKDKDVAVQLLDSFGFKYELLGKSKRSLIGKAMMMLKTNIGLLKIIKQFKPDLLLGIHHESLAQIGYLLGIPSIIFTDTELTAKIGDLLTFPFATVICTPKSFNKNLGSKHIRYNSYHELAYLHPRYFKPNPKVLEDLGLSKGEKVIILRLISWSASHDIEFKLKGINSELELIKSLENYGHVYISSERRLNKQLEKYRLRISPADIHSLLYYSSLYIGEGGTMAVEAAILGTPSIHIESMKNGTPTGALSGNFIELKYKYDLLYFYSDQNLALKKAIEILENEKSKKEWLKKRERLINDKIDVTEWVLKFIDRFINNKPIQQL